MMTYEDALSKVQKLLRLSDSPNANEAATAAAAAQSIMDKYGIEKSMAALAQDNSPVEEEEIQDFSKVEDGSLDSGKARLSTWKISLSSAVSQYNGCKVILSHRIVAGNWSPAIEVIGRASDVRTVRYLYGWLKNEIDRLTDISMQGEGAGRGKSWSSSFRMGCVDTIRQKLQAAREATKQEVIAASTCTAPVVLNAITRWEDRYKDVERWTADNMNLRKTPRRVTTDMSARYAGRSAANSINLGNSRGCLGSGAAQLRG